MSKRIALICQGKGKGFTEGDGFANLDSLDKNVEKVSNVLKEFGDWEIDIHTLKNITELKKNFAYCINEYNPKEILFYYTGHGHNSSNKYFIVGEDDYKVNLQEALEELPKQGVSISVVIDACESEVFAKEWNDDYKYELLTASDYKFAYELEDEGMSYFSFSFVTAIGDGAIYLKDIQLYLENDYKNLPPEKQQVSNHKIPIRNIYRPPLNLIANLDDIKTDYLPHDLNLNLTIELEPIDADNFYVIIWLSAKDGEYLKNVSSDDKIYHKNQIAQYLYDFLEKNYKEFTPEYIYLSFVLPVDLMSENIDFWRLDNNEFLGDFYSISVKSRERFRAVGENHKRKLYPYHDWNINWKNCENKGNRELKKVIYPLDKEIDFSSKKEKYNVKKKPFIVLLYPPNKNDFISLYQSNISILMWVNNCIDYSKFKDFLELEENKTKKFIDLYAEIFDFKTDESKLEGNVMLMYDNPKDIPPDERNIKRMIAPKGEKNGK